LISHPADRRSKKEDLATPVLAFVRVDPSPVLAFLFFYFYSFIPP